MNPAMVLMATSLRRTLVRHTDMVPSLKAYAVWANTHGGTRHGLYAKPELLKRRLPNKFFPALLILLFTILLYPAKAQTNELDQCNIAWNSQSKNAGESMPCGGGDIGLNVWVENNEVFFYIAKSGSFDENNALLKQGRVRIKISPNPFEGASFKQELVLKNGHVQITAKKNNLITTLFIWVDVFNPLIHVDINSSRPVTTTATYENWRFRDRPNKGRANNANSWKWAPPAEVVTGKDAVDFKENTISFYHRNKPEPSVFDITVRQQGLEKVKDQLFNPIKDLTFGGMMEGKNMKPAGIVESNYLDTDFKGWKLQSVKAERSQFINIYLHTAQTATAGQWQAGLDQTIRNTKGKEKAAAAATHNWWQQFWDRSYIFIKPSNASENSSQWQAGRNYQLFRYMLACNASGKYPTKFNGGLFTYDPSCTDSSLKYTPDFRNWGGGTHTAQNQRLVYFPLIKSGDFDMMKPQLDFYLQLLKNAELRTETYWNHKGACFTEQLENFGLPNYAEYGTKRPADFDKGVEYNAWLEYEWDTVLEFCGMMLEQERYANKNIAEYIPFIESCLTFFNEHYQWQAKQRGSKALDGNKKLILYPGSGAETFKMAYNSTSTIAGLKTIVTRLLELPANYLGDDKRRHWDTMLQRIPPISFAQFDGHTTIAPAKLWERINNAESPQLYPVYPWGIYGIGKAGLDTAVNTFRYDTNAVKFRSFIGWKQDNIFAARLGLTKEAAELTIQKLKNSGRRFPAFWGPGYDWTPDHNWGGSGMIGLQEMLLQTNGEKIYLFPAWPKEWDVHFKLHAPYQTTVEAIIKNGQLQMLKVIPESRKKDVVNMF
ncbi:MAG: hypothetical protein JWP81_3089 [Ferruginibacter sp.]|nr:hypothetical protein [Ferruginibacter sp.]